MFSLVFRSDLFCDPLISAYVMFDCSESRQVFAELKSYFLGLYFVDKTR